MVGSAFNLPPNFTQSEMYLFLFFKRLSMFFCCWLDKSLKPSVWPKGATKWPTEVIAAPFP